MKELGIEEKAKRYDELKVTAQELEHDGCFDKITLFDLFPELKEGENERIRKALLNEFIHLHSKGYKFAGLEGEEIIAWLDRQGEQKPADIRTTGYWYVEDVEQKPTWSEDDEQYVKDTLALLAFGASVHTISQVQDWLQSLKDRVQPKQEWSVDDERAYRSVLYNFEHHFPLNCVQQEFVKSHIQPHNRWEPSEGQLECLGYVIEKAEKDWSPLTNNRIYLTLKELKEQLNKLRSDTRTGKII